MSRGDDDSPQSPHDMDPDDEIAEISSAQAAEPGSSSEMNTGTYAKPTPPRPQSPTPLSVVEDFPAPLNAAGGGPVRVRVSTPRAYPPHSSPRMANRVISRARANNALERAFLCFDCFMLPDRPVTGTCGHTRCLGCIEQCVICPCGVSAPEELCINTLMQEMILKLLDTETALRNSHYCKSGKEEDTLVVAKAEKKLDDDVKPLISVREPIIIRAVMPIEERTFRGTISQAISTLLQPKDLQCVICFDTFSKPVTTPCGHTYCRSCLERSLDYRSTCALCMRSLLGFNVRATRETEMVNAALSVIGALRPILPLDPHMIPIFACTVAFPGIPCPLFIFDPRYWLMIRRVLESGSRRFGIVASETEGTYSGYGTVLEVRDCVQLADGCSILSTVGLSRFKVIERDVYEGCDVARIQPLVDVPMTADYLVWELHVLAARISYKTLMWMTNMTSDMRYKIESAFGPMPYMNLHSQWWRSADGPKWLWWLIAILPLRVEIKVLILATHSLHKRLMAVSRTLDAVLEIVFAHTPFLSADFRSSYETWTQRDL